MTPAPDDWQQKVWGQTRCAARGPDSRACQAHAVEGGYSSRHYHPDQANTFFVLSGQLRVESWNGRLPLGVPSVVVTLGPNQAHTANAGVWHRFVALGPVAMIETYSISLSRAEGPPPPDIVRYDEGGVGSPPYGQAHDRDEQQ
jgi:mannose-6-phosphate isomerase-like protein (cupin superfamily)